MSCHLLREKIGASVNLLLETQQEVRFVDMFMTLSGFAYSATFSTINNMKV